MTRKKSENTEEIKKPKAIGPFDIIKMMFTDVASFNNLSNLILSKNFFMINRILSIMFPMQAQCFNNLNINQAEVIRTWQRFATVKLGYGRVPGFVYTKGAKASQEQNKTEIEVNNQNWCKSEWAQFLNVSWNAVDRFCESENITLPNKRNRSKKL